MLPLSSKPPLQSRSLFPLRVYHTIFLLDLGAKGLNGESNLGLSISRLLAIGGPSDLLEETDSSAIEQDGDRGSPAA